MEADLILATDKAVAKHLFDRIARMDKYDLPGLTVWGKPLGEFCGDLIMSAPRPSGGVNVLVGDFIGKGLPAAVAAFPVAEVFYGMTEKGFGLSDIIEEINNKLLFILPESLSCAACLIELEQEGKMLAIWNGGLPDLFIVDQDSKITHRLPSTHAPLGASKMDKVERDTLFVEVDSGDTVFFCTDGIINSLNRNSECYGIDSIENKLSQGATLSDLSASVLEHANGAAQVDDMTILELDISAIQNYNGAPSDKSSQLSYPPALWKADFSFSAQVLKQLDLVPMLIKMLMQIQAPHEHKQRIYTVLAEMLSNALEHGVLKLDSSMKESANGFADYYALRAQRLAVLEEGYIKISFNHEPCEQGGKLTIRIEDSGNGFDYQKHARDLAGNLIFCGRGEGLLSQLCADYSYSGQGNIITATYIWA